MSVPNQTPYNIYTANGLTTVFAYEFYLISASDIQVTINGNEVTSGYTVSGVGNTNGGEVTFLTAPANGATVILERVTPTYRLTDYQDNGDLLADTVNKDFDRLWMAIQRAFIYLGVALTRPLFGGGPFNANGYRISNLADPVNDQDAATKKFVAAAISGNKSEWQEGDRVLDNKIDANFRRTLRVPESDVEEIFPVAGRRNSLFGWNSSGRPIPVFGMTETADLAIKLASNEESLGANLVGVYPAGTVQDSIQWVTPLAFSSLEACFQSGVEDVLIPAGTYTITKKMRVDITHNLNIVCQPGAVFKLADNVRQNMLVFVGNGTNNFSWKGGEIDGNWEGQGGETLDGNGNIQDVSHGLIVSMFNRAVVTGVHAHDCMGHHINHGGNWFFHAYDIDLKSHPSALKPEEGARGDGITGCSRHILIENIRGFTTDDFVGIFAGINWIEGIGPESGGYRDIDSIVLRNLNPQSLTVDGVTYPAWTGCSIRPCYGKKIPYIDIDGIHGDVRAAGARLHTAVVTTWGAAPPSEYWGSFGHISVRNVSVQVHGKSSDSFTNKLSNAAVQIGSPNPNRYSTVGDYIQRADSVTIENVSARIGPYSLAAVTIGHLQCDRVKVDGLSLTYDDNTLAAEGVVFLGQNTIRELTLNNVRQQRSDDPSETVMASRRVLDSFYGGDICTVRGSNLSRFVSATDGNALANVLTNNTDYGAASKLLFASYDYILTPAVAFGQVAFSRSMKMSVAKVGRYSVSPNGVKQLEDYVSTWDTTDYGVPSAANFPGYSSMSWTEGTFIPVRGSTHHDCVGYICRSALPTFQLQSPDVSDAFDEITPAWTPESATPGARFTTFVTSGSWPVSGGGMVETSISTKTSGVRAVQVFTPTSFLAKYTRLYQSGAWGSWKSTPYA